MSVMEKLLGIIENFLKEELGGRVFHDFRFTLMHNLLPAEGELRTGVVRVCDGSIPVYVMGPFLCL